MIEYQQQHQYKYIYIIVYIVCSSIGMRMMKKAISFRTIEYLVGISIFAASSLLWIFLITRLPLASTFAMVSGLLCISTMLIGRYSLREKISIKQNIGTILILIGIIAIEAKF